MQPILGRDEDGAEPTTPSRAASHRKRLQTGAAGPRRILGAAAASSQTTTTESPKSKMRNKTQNTDELRLDLFVVHSWSSSQRKQIPVLTLAHYFLKTLTFVRSEQLKEGT